MSNLQSGNAFCQRLACGTEQRLNSIDGLRIRVPHPFHYRAERNNTTP